MVETEPFDRRAALQRASADEDLLREIAAVFLNSYPKWMSDMKKAIADGDLEVLGFAAHTLKGAVGTLGAQHAFKNAEKLELMVEQGILAGADEALATLQEEIARLSSALSICLSGATLCVS